MAKVVKSYFYISDRGEERGEACCVLGSIHPGFSSHADH